MRPNWFIGFPVPAGGWLEDISQSVPEDIRLFHPDDLHITLAFLGSVERSFALQAWKQATVYPPPRTPITLGKLLPFGLKRRPSAYSFVLTQGHERIAEFMERRQAEMLTAAGRPSETRSPLPHLTIARIPRRADRALRRSVSEWAKSVQAPPGVMMVDRLALFTWAEDRSVRQFRIEEEIALE